MGDASVSVRNAVLHLIEAVTGRRAGPYDVDCVLGSLIADGMEIVPRRDPWAASLEGETE